MGSPIPEQCIREILASRPNADELWVRIKVTFHPKCFELGGTVSRYNLHLRWNAEHSSVGSAMPPVIFLATGTGRIAAALSHELLHLELARAGYPRLIQNSVKGNEGNKINAILNVIDHKLMLPRFVSLGFPPSEFLADDAYNDEVISRCIGCFSVAAEFETLTAYHTKLLAFLDSEQLGENAWFAQFNGQVWEEVND